MKWGREIGPTVSVYRPVVVWSGKLGFLVTKIQRVYLPTVGDRVIVSRSLDPITEVPPTHVNNSFGKWLIFIYSVL